MTFFARCLVVPKLSQMQLETDGGVLSILMPGLYKSITYVLCLANAATPISLVVIA